MGLPDDDDGGDIVTVIDATAVNEAKSNIFGHAAFRPRMLLALMCQEHRSVP